MSFLLLAQLKALCAKCEFPDADSFKIHSFRHAFASMLARQNVSDRHALDLMGQSSSDLLDHYVRLYEEDLQKAVRAVKLPKLENKA